MFNSDISGSVKIVLYVNVRFLEKMKGNQSLYLKIACVFGVLLIFSLIGQFFLPYSLNWSNLNFPIIFLLFWVGLFLTERYRYYCLNIGLNVIAIMYICFLCIDTALKKQWGFILYGFGIVPFVIFARYSYRVIKLGKQLKS